MNAFSTDVAGNLRAWARGVYSTEAATELLIRALDRGSSADQPWIKTTKRGHWIDFADVENQIGSLSGCEQRLLSFAASIGSK